MTRRLHVTARALANLESIVTYAAENDGRAAAEAFGDAVLRRCERMAQLPGILGTARPDLAPDLRSTPHRRYIVYFRYLGHAIEVVAVLDARRDALAYFSQGDDA